VPSAWECTRRLRASPQKYRTGRLSSRKAANRRSADPAPAYDIALGARGDEDDLRHRLDVALAVEQPNIEALLCSYHIPRLPPAAQSAAR
jgi:hypothetical protein